MRFISGSIFINSAIILSGYVKAPPDKAYIISGLNLKQPPDFEDLHAEGIEPLKFF